MATAPILKSVDAKRKNIPTAEYQSVLSVFTERQLLHVACTRARDHLLVTGAAPASEFLDDLGLR